MFSGAPRRERSSPLRFPAGRSRNSARFGLNLGWLLRSLTDLWRLPLDPALDADLAEFGAALGDPWNE